jgi:hypothetical protein
MVLGGGRDGVHLSVGFVGLVVPPAFVELSSPLHLSSTVPLRVIVFLLHRTVASTSRDAQQATHHQGLAAVHEIDSVEAIHRVVAASVPSTDVLVLAVPRSNQSACVNHQRESLLGTEIYSWQ